MVDYKTHMDVLFSDNKKFQLKRVMWELSEPERDEAHYFTNYELLRRITQTHQRAYIELLSAVAAHHTENHALFNIAHENIGRKISQVAKAAGYEQKPAPTVTDVNIWGDPAQAVCYHRSERVVEPE